MYSEWAEGQCEKIRRILNSAREDHTAAVKERIQGVKGMEGVVETTKAMFEVSKVRLHCIGPLSSKSSNVRGNTRKPPISKPKPLNSSNAPI